MTYCNKIQWQYSLAVRSILVSHCPQRSRSGLRNMSSQATFPAVPHPKNWIKLANAAKRNVFLKWEYPDAAPQTAGEYLLAGRVFADGMQKGRM